MHCANCGTLLPQGANACPSCGTLSPLLHENDATAVSSAGASQTVKPAEGVRMPSPSLPIESQVTSAPSPPQKPPTYSAAQPYYTSESNPYDGGVSNPYGDSYASSPYHTDGPPPPPAIKKRKNTTAFVVLLGVLLLALVSAGAFVFMAKSGTGSQGSGQTPSGQQNQPTSPLEKQARYNRTIGTVPLVNDPLSGPDNYGLDNYTGPGGYTRCFFSQGQLHAFGQPTYFSPCYAKATNYQDFVLQVKMTIISGHSGGLVFRANYTNDAGYQFRISTDGTYILNRIILDQQGNPQPAGETIASGSSAFVRQGANQTNQLGVMAQGNTISLFINGKYVASATDSTYHSGQVGVYVDSDAGAVEGAFSDLKVWKLL